MNFMEEINKKNMDQISLLCHTFAAQKWVGQQQLPYVYSFLGRIFSVSKKIMARNLKIFIASTIIIKYLHSIW